MIKEISTQELDILDVCSWSVEMHDRLSVIEVIKIAKEPYYYRMLGVQLANMRKLVVPISERLENCPVNMNYYRSDAKRTITTIDNLIQRIDLVLKENGWSILSGI